MSRNHKQQGFSLVELLLGLVILGFILGIASLSIRPGTAASVPGMITELRLSIDAVGELAIARSELLALQLGQQQRSFELQRFDARENKWLALESDDSPDLQLPDDFKLRIELDERRIEQTLVNLDQVLFYPHGEHSPFKIVLLTDQAQHATLISDGLSLVSLP